MKNRKIQYLEKYYCLAFVIFFIIFFCILLFISIKNEIYAATIVLPIFIVYFTFICVIIYNYNIVFDYKNQNIKVLEPGTFKSTVIKMSEIKNVNFYETKTKRKSCILFRERLMFNFTPSYVYNYGKKYIIEFFIKNGQSIKIFYNSLYRTNDLKNTRKFELKVKEILKEFNDFKYETYFKKN